MNTMRRLLLGAIVGLSAVSLWGQQLNPPDVQAPKPEEKAAVIRFFADVNSANIGTLLQTVDAQFKLGVRKFIILISSGGGDLLSGFMTYNYLKGLPIELTTFNVGNVDSAASIIYCAGSKRYAVPDSRFIVHEVSLQFQFSGTGAVNIDLPTLEGQLSLLKGQELSMARILASTVGKPESEAEERIHAQASMSSSDAQKWGLVQEIRTQLFDPANANLVLAIPSPAPSPQPGQQPSMPTVPQFSYAAY